MKNCYELVTYFKCRVLRKWSQGQFMLKSILTLFSKQLFYFIEQIIKLNVAFYKIIRRLISDNFSQYFIVRLKIGKHNDFCLFSFFSFSQKLKHCHTIHYRHSNIKKDQVGIFALCFFKPLLP